MADEPNALTVVPPAPAVVARDLASRGPRDMLYVNRHGQGISPMRAWVPMVAAITGNWAMVVLLGVSWWTLFVVLGMVAWIAPQHRRARRGSALLLSGGLDDAEAALTPLARSWLSHPDYHVNAIAGLARLSAQRGDHAQALVWLRRLRRWSWPRVTVRVLRLEEIVALVNLGKVAEARALFTARHREEPRGDVLRYRHWQTELYLALAEGRHALDADELHRRVRTALGMTTGRELIALLAWAHHHVGDTTQAWHLLREALGREDVLHVRHAMPRLHAWMEQHRAAALEAAPSDDALADELAQLEAPAR